MMKKNAEVSIICQNECYAASILITTLEDLADKPEEVVDDENANNMIEINGEVMTPGHFFSQRNPPMGAIDAESNKMTPARRVSM